MSLFRKTARRDPLIVTMTGAALGSRVLILCADDDALPLDIAAKVGLSGQAVALAPDASRADAMARRAERRGIYIDRGVIALPFPCADQTLDLVIADDRPRPAGVRTAPPLLAEALRVLRPGGRLVVLRSAGVWPWARGGSDASEATAAALLQELLGAGFRAAREIAARQGIRFLEGAKGA